MAGFANYGDYGDYGDYGGNSRGNSWLTMSGKPRETDGMAVEFR